MKIPSNSAFTDAQAETTSPVYCALRARYVGSGFEIGLIGSDVGVRALADVFQDFDPAQGPLRGDAEIGAGEAGRLSLLRLVGIADVSETLRILKQIVLLHDAGSIAFCCGVNRSAITPAGVLPAIHAVTRTLAEILAEELLQDGVRLIRRLPVSQDKDELVRFFFYRPVPKPETDSGSDACRRLREWQLEEAVMAMWTQPVPHDRRACH